MQYEVVNQREVSSFIASHIISVLCESGQESVPGLAHVLVRQLIRYTQLRVAGPECFCVAKTSPLFGLRAQGRKR